MEHLTGTSPNDNYKVTIRRASFLSGDRTVIQNKFSCTLKIIGIEQCIKIQKITILRLLCINSNVTLEALILFHLGNGFGFKDITDATSVLDLPCDKSDLEKKIKVLNYARKFLGFV